MRFDNDYWHALDKQTAERIDVSPRYIGRSTSPMADQVEGLKTRIFQGATHVELGFWGTGKGSKQQGSTTPEMYGKEQREALRQMAKINDLTLSVHSAPNIGAVSGMTEQGFSDEAQERSLNEIKRTVDFAADVTGGGPVVVHLQREFPKPIFEREGFEAYKEEGEKAPIYLVNEDTGQMSPLRRDQKISVVDEDETKKHGELRFKERKFEDFVNEFDQFPDAKKEEYNNSPGKYFYQTFMEKEIKTMEGESEKFFHQAQKAQKSRENFEKMIDGYDRHIKESGDKEVAKRIYADSIVGQLSDSGVLPKDLKYRDPEAYKQIMENPKSFFAENIKEAKREEKYWKESAEGYGMRAESIKKDMSHLKPLEEVGVNRTSQGIARAAMYAYEKEKKMGLDKPLFIAPENIFPEMGYGAHPEELKEVVLKSRREMVNKLLQEKKSMSREQAEKIAKEHIKATFDIGHAYTWKKFFDEKKAGKNFNTWLKDQVNELNEKEIIGHVHLSDNFGYYDEELPVGEGTAPVKEFVKQMREEGYKDKMVVESPEDLALYPAWKTLSSPIYRINGATSTWTEIQGSYFGRTASPTYIVGEGVRPSEDWTFWSGIPLE